MTSALSPSSSSLLVIGLGLIGGSVLRAAHAADVCERYYGYDANEQTMVLAKEQGLIDNDSEGLRELAELADIIVLAVPTLGFDAVFVELGQATLKPNVALSDVASVKGPVIESCAVAAPHLLPFFLPGHPIAGSEKSGLLASKADLFTGKKLIVTPHDKVSRHVQTEIMAFWAALECDVVEASPELHDDILASTSHLPHVLAYVLVDSLLQHQYKDRLFEFAAGGFASISRTASSDPIMWHDIFMSNKAAILEAIGGFEQRLQLFKTYLEEGQSDQLHDMLSEAKNGRDSYLERYDS